MRASTPITQEIPRSLGALCQEPEVKVTQSCPTLCNPMDCTNPWNSPGQNNGVGSCSLLQGIFPIQGSNPCLPHCRQILYQLSHKGSPDLCKDEIKKHKVGAQQLLVPFSLCCEITISNPSIHRIVLSVRRHSHIHVGVYHSIHSNHPCCSNMVDILLTQGNESSCSPSLNVFSPNYVYGLTFYIYFNCAQMSSHCGLS